MYSLRAVGLLLTTFLVLILVGCGFNSPTVRTQVVTIVTNTLSPIVSTTPRFTATLEPTGTLIPTVTSSPTETLPPATPTPTATVTATPAIRGTVNFTGQPVNLRNGPGQTFSVIQGVPGGTTLTVLGLNDGKDWYNVRLDSGTEGWLAVALVTVTNPNTVAIVTTLTLTPRALTASAQPPGGTPGLGQAPPVGTPRKPFVRTPNDVLAYCDKPGGQGEPRKTLNEGTEVSLWWSWWAITPEQLDDHIKQSEYEIKVDGQPITNWRNFQTSVQRSSADGRYHVFWFVPIGKPSTGEHRVEFKLTWKQKISDGLQEFGPGTAQETDSGSCIFTIR